MSREMRASEGTLRPYFSETGAWAFSIGTSIGWGSFIVTCSTYLSQAGILGTALGLVLGMAVILVITHNLSYMMIRCPDAGGIYTYGRRVFGDDSAFLVGWMLLLTYLAVLWANITSLPVFARSFFGNFFQFGYCYTVFQYPVYLGEVLLCVAGITLIGYLCIRTRKVPQYLMIAMAVMFLGSLTVCTVLALTGRGSAGFTFDPVFLPDKNRLGQILRIAVISPWAFIGFENVTHFAGEFSYPVKRVRGVMLASVVLTTLFYILMTLLSASAYPPQYGSWLEYIGDMGSQEGLAAIPAFYAASYYMGDWGVALLILALLSVILTSLIGNLTAISRLLYAFGRDHSWAAGLGRVNRHSVPENAILVTVALSCFIPFLGRTAIGWIVDVTTLGATLIYGLQSAFVYRDARTRGDRTERITGSVGIFLMIVFGIFLLAPKLLNYEAMAAESYLLFVAWSFLGLMVFRFVLTRARDSRYGHSVIVWVVLLLLMLMTIMMWENKEMQQITAGSLQEIRQFIQRYAEVDPEATAEINQFLEKEGVQIENATILGTAITFGLFMAAVILMMNNYHAARRRAAELQSQLGAAREIGLTDSLTGVKNKHAYTQWEERIDLQIRRGEAEAFAVVVCDVNNLKFVNDTYGHKAGDERIQRACARICQVFSHSPVFRYGGDEFVVLLFGEDYREREGLLARLMAHTDANPERENTIAAGMAEYRSGESDCLLSVFEEADHTMYEKKKQMHAAAGQKR